MRAKAVLGLGRVVLSSRERPILIEPMGNGLRGIILRFAHEIRSQTDLFAEIPDMHLPYRDARLGRAHDRDDDGRIRSHYA